MKLFFSYPHTEEGTENRPDLCRMICESLARRHQVYIDVNQLSGKHGADWRLELTKAIRESQAVVSCMNRRAVREGGVCLDELKLAVNLKGGNILGILLEPESEVKPHASLGHRQWLDMSDWPARWAEGEETFSRWYAEMEEKLLRMLSDSDVAGFDTEMEAVRRFMPYADFRVSKKELLDSTYSGCEWLSAQVEAWLRDPEGTRLCALYGGPGTGKSTFAVNYAFGNPDIAAILCFEYNKTNYSSTRTMIQSIAWQLAVRLPNYRHRLAEVLRLYSRDQLGDSEMLDQMLIKPLTDAYIDGGQETLCIILDGLDECSRDESNPVAALICECAERFPRWLRILVTSRPEGAVKMHLPPCLVLEIGNGSWENLKEIAAYFDRELEQYIPDEDRRWEAAVALTARSEGNFLYASLAVKAFREGKMDPAGTDDYPIGLDQQIYRWMERIFPDDREYREKFRLPIGMLAASPEPLPEEELDLLPGMSENDRNDLLFRLRIFLKKVYNIYRQETVSFEHKYVQEFFSRNPGSNRFHMSERDALRALAEGCLRKFRQDVESLNNYELCYMLDFFAETGMEDAYEEAAGSRELRGRFMKLSDFAQSIRLTGVYEKMNRNIVLITNRLRRDGNLYDAAVWLSSRITLAELERNKGHYDEAIRELEDCLAELPGLGLREPDEAYFHIQCKGQIATCLARRGETEQAMEMVTVLASGLEKEARESGDILIWTDILWLRILMADILLVSARTEEALSECRKTLELAEELLPETRADSDTRKRILKMTANAECQMSGILVSQGKVNQGYSYLQSALERLAAHERDNPDFAARKWNVYEQVVQVTELMDAAESGPVPGKLAWQRAGDEAWLPAETFDLTACLEKVEGLLDGISGLAAQCRSVGGRICSGRGFRDDPQVMEDLCGQLADILEEEGYPEEALELYFGALILWTNEPQEGRAENLPRAAELCEKAADLLAGQEKHEEALPLYRKNAELRRSAAERSGLPEDHWKLACAMYYLGGHLMNNMRRYREALPCFLEAYNLSVNLMDTIGEARAQSRVFQKAYVRCEAMV